MALRRHKPGRIASVTYRTENHILATALRNNLFNIHWRIDGRFDHIFKSFTPPMDQSKEIRAIRTKETKNRSH